MPVWLFFAFFVKWSIDFNRLSFNMFVGPLDGQDKTNPEGNDLLSEWHMRSIYGNDTIYCSQNNWYIARHICVVTKLADFEIVPGEGAIIIDEHSLFGCITNVYHGHTRLLDRLCSNGDSSSEEQSDSPPSPRLAYSLAPSQGVQPVYVAEPLQVNEGASMPLQWKNVYVLPEHSRLNISNKEILFSIVDGPRHGALSLSGVSIASFTYADLLSRNVVYSHDGSETSEDSFDFQIEINSKLIDFPWLESTTYTLKIIVNAVNDAPDLIDSTNGNVVKITAKGSRVLTSDILRVQDSDDSPDKVRVQVVEAKGVHLKVGNATVHEFTQRQFISGAVSLVDDGISEHSTLRLVARDREARSTVLGLKIASVPIDVRLQRNTGVKLLHHGSAVITNSNLSFSASVPDLSLHYRIVGLPDSGVVECSPPNGHFTVCSAFTQDQINDGLVRFRHTGNGHPTLDTFSFQVESGDFVSMVHTFRLIFIPMNVKVFNREVFMLNGTDQEVLGRANLFAWTFPKSYAADKLIYYIIEPPKFGILSRKIGKKNRRIGVSSNFTQEDIDNGLISYRLHFMQYNIMNDYFLFRVISPAVQSESQRFEIIFVPSPTSIQLINRTVIVREGENVAITSDFLSLSTSDDRNFVFTISIPPQFGTISIRKENGARLPLAVGHNFTTSTVNEGRLFYEHHGAESRVDRVYLVAESAFRAGTRIPFWCTFSVILQNDNPPRLIGNDTIYMIERGERILHPFMIDWRDEDIDANSLQFNFHQPIKDAAVLSTVSPHLPTSIFSMDDLQKEKLMLRHLGHKANFTIKYTVSDGLHTVDGLLNIIARHPFVNVENSELFFCCQIGDTPQIHVSPNNISVLTNLDVVPEKIVYSTPSSHFILKANGTQRIVGQFTQKNINDGFIFYNVHSASKEPVTIVVGDRKIYSEVKISRRSLGSSLELRRSAPISVAVGNAIHIDNNTIVQGDGVTSSDQLIFIVTRHPSEGNLVLEGGSAFVSHFSQADVDSGRVQYLHTGRSAGRDSIQMNISSPHITKGPYTLYIDVFEHHVSLNTSMMSVVDGGSTVISTSVIKVISSDKDDYMLKVEVPPKAGWIVKESWNIANITSVDFFTGTELRERRVVYVSDRSATSSRDAFQIVACISGGTCTSRKTVDVLITQTNKQSPHLLRNEVLRVMSAQSAVITNSLLGTEDADTPPDRVHFLISRPSNGFVARIDEPMTHIYNFSQKDVDENRVAFYKHANVSGSGGFSFLISDGVHQVGPEWFTIESWANQISVALEANSRLIASPDIHSVISIDLLRANIPSASASEILFSVTKPPKYGKLMVDGIEKHKFSQLEVNRRLVSYFCNSSSQSEWTRRDTFNFVVSANGSAQPIDEEYRFRISSTYAVLPSEVLSQFVFTSTVFVSKGGSTAFNLSHLSLEKLAKSVDKDVLLLEMAKSPRHGDCEWVDSPKGVVAWSEYERGLPLLYRHTGESERDDEVVFYVYPVSESTRRTSRLRVTVPIRVTPIRDPLVQIVKFPRQISVVSGGAVPLLVHSFFSNHPNVPPQSIVYEVVQNGRNGARIKVSHKKRNLFSQEELTQGLVSVVHTPSLTSPSSTDVLVLSIEGHSRALVIKIRPLDLALENHTAITYPQGKTYVVLNRSHLGAYSNGDRSKITYKITSPPENGTFYWVAGEKEAKNFTQSDIDEGKVLYAQLNMHSYRDSFEFVMGNEDRDVLRNRSEILVRSLVEAQPIIVETNTSTPVTTSQLNATLLEGSTPRFLVTSPPKYGRLSLDPDSSHSALFFTFSDIVRGRVLYESFSNFDEVTDNIELEVRADSVQPARLILPITILPSEVEVEKKEERVNEMEGGGVQTEDDEEALTPDGLPRLSPINNHLPILLLVLILILTVVILLCRLRNTNEKKNSAGDGKGTEDVPPQSLDKPDLLGSTVFASIGRAEQQQHQQQTAQRVPLSTFESRSSIPSQTPREKRRHLPSLDYAGLNVDTPPPMPLFKQIASPPGNNQYWV